MFFHRHKWKVTGAQQLFRTNSAQPERHGTPVTEVLIVCECGAFQTRCIDGHWTLEQLQPDKAKAEADREYFRKLGVKL